MHARVCRRYSLIVFNQLSTDVVRKVEVLVSTPKLVVIDAETGENVPAQIEPVIIPRTLAIAVDQLKVMNERRYIEKIENLLKR